MNSNYAALKEKEEEEEGKTCAGRWWAWWTKKSPPTVAETMSMLQHTRLQLDLNMNHCRQCIAKHEQKMCKYAEDSHMRSAALREFRMIKHYRERHDRWHAMSANLETVLSEIQSQQQTIAVFGAYTRANEVMGKLAERVDMSSLCEILDTLRDRMEEGRDMSDVMGSAFNAEADSSELEAEFDAFMLSERKKKFFIQEGGESLQLSTQQQQRTNNNVREGEQTKKRRKKNIFFCLFLPSSGGVGGGWGVIPRVCEDAGACRGGRGECCARVDEKHFFFLKRLTPLLWDGVGWYGWGMGSSTPSPAPERGVEASRKKNIFFSCLFRSWCWWCLGVR